MPSFAELLKQYREEHGASQRGLAQATRINQAIISRFESGDRGPSGPEQVLAIIDALHLDEARASALLGSAGYWPRAFMDLGPSDPTLLAVVRLLAHAEMSDERKLRFRRIVELLVDAWSTA